MSRSSLIVSPEAQHGTERDWPLWFAGLHAAAAHIQARDIDTYLRLCRAKEFIDQNFDGPIDLACIAKQAHFSRYHFLRSFRRVFDMTPHQYLTRKRIDRAKELLTESDMPVTAICLEVGFQSLGSFSSLFQRHVGHSPNRYRARLVQSLGIPGLPSGLVIPGCFLSVFGTETVADPCHPGP